MRDSAKFWDKIAPKYARHKIGDESAYQYTLGRTKSYLKPGDRVLELGCGTGSTAVLLAPHVREIVGTDLSHAMIDIARTKAQAAGLENADFRVAPAQDAVETRESFDVVLGHSLFHLLDSADEIYREIHRILPVGGYFISKTPCLGDRSFGWKRFPVRAILPVLQMFGKAPSMRFLTHRALENEIASAGFDIVESGSFPAMSRYIVARKT